MVTHREGGNGMVSQRYDSQLQSRAEIGLANALYR
jgi:hypothetical protein